LEETVVQESNIIRKRTKCDGNKAVLAVHGRLWLSKPEIILQASQKNSRGRRDGSSELLEHAKSILTIHHIGFASSLCNNFASLDAVGEGEQDSPLLPLPDSPLVSLQRLVWRELSHVTSPNLQLCWAEKNTAVSI